VVYGQELMPGRVGMVSGLFFGFIFGIGGIGAALLGTLADWEGQRVPARQNRNPRLMWPPAAAPSGR
jgi:hypothetical protein